MLRRSAALATLTLLSLGLVFSTNVRAQSDDDALNQYIWNLPKEDLSEAEVGGLLKMREEEKLARDVYRALYDKWQQTVFANIAASEQTHTDLVRLLLDKYNLEDPVIDSVGVFKDSTLQALHDTLVAIGTVSLDSAIYVGCTIEDLDIWDLEELLAETDNQDVRTVYQNLMKGSRNHMRAFTKQYKKLGKTYVPQFISQEEYTQIINSPIEPGIVDADGNPLTLSSVEDSRLSQQPKRFQLMHNYPNPFNPTTAIRFSLPTSSVVSLKVYDVRGTLVKTLIDNRLVAGGVHTVSWNGTDEAGNTVPSGVYFCRLQTRTSTATIRMIFAK